MESSTLTEYNPWRFPPVAVTTDVVLFSILDNALHLVLVERGVEPYLGRWALPGGFVRPREDLEPGAYRELSEETGIPEESLYLEQLATYGHPYRDPRMRVITVAYWGVCASALYPAGGGDAARAELVRVSRIEQGEIGLAFDHDRIVADGLARLRAKLEYTAIAAKFCRSEFTISELRNVYEAVWNTKLNPGNFQRKVRQNSAFKLVGFPDPGQTKDDDPNGAGMRNVANRRLQDRSVPRTALQSVMYMTALPMESRETPPSRVRARRDSKTSGRAIARHSRTLPRRRSGRPPTLWSADSGRRLNSPFVRRPS